MKSIKIKQIGFIDWGIGGLGVLKEVQALAPKVSFIYFSDSGFKPYGKVSKSALTKRLHEVTDFFRKKNITTIVLACNAASTVLEELQKKNLDIQYFGMLTSGKKSILKSKKISVLVLGGQRTIDCGYFQDEFKNSKIQVQGLIAQPLSALIEKGLHQSKKFEAELDLLAKQTDFKPEAVLLACTHYPAATKQFEKKFLNALILDPALQVAAQLKPLLKTSAKANSLFLTTGSVKQSTTSAELAFQLKKLAFKKVSL